MEAPQKKNVLGKIWGVVDLGRRLVNEVTNHPRVTTFGSLLIFLVSLKLISKELNQFALADLSRAFDDVRISTTLFAILAVIISFVALGINDRFCLAMIGKRLPIWRTSRAAVAAYALAKTLGYSWAIASTARARLYRKWGLTQGEVGALSMTTGTAAQIGAFSAASFGLFFGAAEITRHGRFDELFWWFIAIILALPALFCIYYLRKGALSFNWGSCKVNLPNFRRGLAHISAVMFDKIGAALALYLLLPDHGGWAFPAFLAVFILAGLLGALSGAPGGLGVFEAAILTMAPTTQNIPGAAVALVVYRLIYNIFPLIAATIIMGLDHAAPVARPAAKVAQKIGVKAVDFSPQIFAVLVFGAGYILIGAAASPAITQRLMQLEAIFSPQFLEIAHFATVIIGAGLMLCANYIFRENRNAFWFAFGLLIMGAILSLFKAFAWEIALALAIIFALGFVAYREIDPQVIHNKRPLSYRWVAAIIGSLASIMWFSFFAFQNINYNWQLWFDVGTNADAARALRATAGAWAAIILGIFVIWLFGEDKDTD